MGNNAGWIERHQESVVVTYLDGHSKAHKLEFLLQKNNFGIRPLWTIEDD